LSMLVSIDKSKLAGADGKIVKRADFTEMLSAQEVVAGARRYAVEMQTTVEASVQAARQAGHEEGLRIAREEFAASVVETTARMESAFVGLEARIVNTVMGALQRILLQIDDREVLKGLIQRVLAEGRSQKHLRLRVAAVQFNEVNAALALVLRDFPEVEFIDVVKDPNAARGTCVLESDFGVIDASLDMQLAAVRRGLINAFVGKRQITDP
jgi:type III secretion protein L